MVKPQLYKFNQFKCPQNTFQPFHYNQSIDSIIIKPPSTSLHPYFPSKTLILQCCIRYQSHLPNHPLIIIFIFYSNLPIMKTHQNKHSIQEMQQGERDFGVMNIMKTIHKKVLNNHLVSEFDVFSVPVKLTLKGQEVYKTFCGGFVHLLLLGICVLITISILFPSGIQLQSQLSVTTVPSSGTDQQQTLFDHTDQIISWRGLSKDWSGNILGYTEIANFSTFKAYLQDSQNNPIQLDISTQCSTEGAEFCIKKSAINSKATFLGNYYDPEVYTKYLVIQKFWCDYIMDPNCLVMPYEYSLEIKMTNFYKQKGGSLIPTTSRIITNWYNRHYTLNVTSEVFTSNSKFFGHLANILPFETRTFMFSDFMESLDIVDPTIELISLVPNGTWDYGQVRMTPCGWTREINQNFDDISEILLFFLSVSQTFYIVVFFLFIKHYNRNSGLLQIADSLFYIDDPKTKKKYNFRSGYQVFFACLLYNHPIYKVINFILTKLGSSLEEALPSKAICAIKLMKKTEEILQENSFYGNLNELSSMETEASRKIKLIEEEEQQKEQEKQICYFPFLPNDSDTDKKDKQLKRQAFEQFCAANEYISAQRKNHAYKVITQRKLKHMLVHEMQKEFMEFVRNARIQKTTDVYQEVPDGEMSEIMVAVHDTSKQQMTAQNFIRT